MNHIFKTEDGEWCFLYRQFKRSTMGRGFGTARQRKVATGLLFPVRVRNYHMYQFVWIFLQEQING